MYVIGVEWVAYINCIIYSYVNNIARSIARSLYSIFTELLFQFSL